MDSVVFLPDQTDWSEVAHSPLRPDCSESTLAVINEVGIDKMYSLVFATIRPRPKSVRNFIAMSTDTSRFGDANVLARLQMKSRLILQPRVRVN